MKQQLFEQITKVLAMINDRRGDPVGVLECASMLSTINYSLGDLYVSARILADNTETEHKRRYNDSFLQYRQDGLAIEESKVKALNDNMAFYQAYIEADHEALSLRIKRDDIQAKVSVAQSYCAELRNQRNFEQSANK